ncbi:MAG: molecular chaperone DnaJ [Deltaproteobacteria bacterium]|nr:molecular chaperone DnaJ [Deltaproteobacteria bacterium]
MSSKRDYYEVLGIARTAASDEIRKAYKQAALKYHPDRNPNDKEAEGKFKEATEAYSVLSDDEKRRRYDQFGHEGLEGMGGFDFSQVDIFSHFQDLFSEFFGGFGGGGGRSRRGPQRGQDLRIQQRITLQESVLGCKKEISVRSPVRCSSCDGSGAAPGHSRETCQMCRGSGQVSTARGFVMFTSACPNCQGEGSAVSHPCEKCRGAGQVDETRKVLVSFPAGIDAGQRLRVPGQGMPGPKGAQSGDLYVDVDLEADERFERDGTDLATRAHVNFADAALGVVIQIPMLDDTMLDVELPAGTQPGDVITLKGKGVPRIDGRGKGSLHVIVQVDVPKRVNQRVRALLLELQKELQTQTEKRAASGRE